MSTGKQILICFVALMAFCAILLPIGLRLAKQEDDKRARYYAPGLALYNKGEYQNAESDFRAMLAHADPNVEEAPTHYQLGMCLLQEGRKDEAEQEFHTAFENGQVSKGEDPCAAKAETALKWMQQNPNWQPVGQTSAVPGPPKDFPASND